MKYLLAGAMALVMASGSALGQARGNDSDLSYSYIEGGWSRLNIDFPGDSFNEDGFNVRGSLELSQSFYGLASWDRWEIGDLDTDLTRFGLGYRAAINRDVDWFGELSLTHLDIEDFGDETGGRFDLGVRAMAGERVELRGFGGYNMDGPEEDSFVLGGDVLVHLTPSLGLSAGVESYEFDTNIYRANLRLSF